MNTSQTAQSFIAGYIPLVLDSIKNDFSDNYDSYRFGPEKLKSENRESSILSTARSILSMLGLATAGTVKLLESQKRVVHEQLNHALQCYLPHLTEIEWLHSHLADEESQEILCKVLAFRALGHRKVRLPLSTPEYWREIREIEANTSEEGSFDLGLLGFRANKMDLNSLGYPIQLFFPPFAAYIQFVLEPYKCQTASGLVEVEPGDVVMDCGGCYGDTALYFANKAGDTGNIYSFEFVPTNLETWNRNIDMNPHLKPRIHLVKAPVWSQSGQPLFIEGTGPGSRVVAETQSREALEVKTVSIDDLVREHDLETVNFIKMDIEGAELAALRGAENTIKRFRPKLAISVYHNLEDFWSIPQYLQGLELNYRFYLRHFTIHDEETVLFAVAE